MMSHSPPTPPLPPPAGAPREHLDYLLTAYVFESLSAAGRAEVERHLAECESCRIQLEETRATLELATAALDDGGRSYVFDLQRKDRVLKAAAASRQGWGPGSRNPFKLSWKLGAVAALLMVGVLLAVVSLPQLGRARNYDRNTATAFRDRSDWAERTDIAGGTELGYVNSAPTTSPAAPAVTAPTLGTESNSFPDGLYSAREHTGEMKVKGNTKSGGRGLSSGPVAKSEPAKKPAPAIQEAIPKNRDGFAEDLQNSAGNVAGLKYEVQAQKEFSELSLSKERLESEKKIARGTVQKPDSDGDSDLRYRRYAVPLSKTFEAPTAIVDSTVSMAAGIVAPIEITGERAAVASEATRGLKLNSATPSSGKPAEYFFDVDHPTGGGVAQSDGKDQLQRQDLKREPALAPITPTAPVAAPSTATIAPITSPTSATALPGTPPSIVSGPREAAAPRPALAPSKPATPALPKIVAPGQPDNNAFVIAAGEQRDMLSAKLSDPASAAPGSKPLISFGVSTLAGDELQLKSQVDELRADLSKEGEGQNKLSELVARKHKSTVVIGGLVQAFDGPGAVPQNGVVALNNPVPPVQRVTLQGVQPDQTFKLSIKGNVKGTAPSTVDGVLTDSYGPPAKNFPIGGGPGASSPLPGDKDWKEGKATTELRTLSELETLTQKLNVMNLEAAQKNATMGRATIDENARQPDGGKPVTKLGIDALEESIKEEARVRVDRSRLLETDEHAISVPGTFGGSGGGGAAAGQAVTGGDGIAIRGGRALSREDLLQKSENGRFGTALRYEGASIEGLAIQDKEKSGGLEYTQLFNRSPEFDESIVSAQRGRTLGDLADVDAREKLNRGEMARGTEPLLQREQISNRSVDNLSDFFSGDLDSLKGGKTSNNDYLWSFNADLDSSTSVGDGRERAKIPAINGIPALGRLSDSGLARVQFADEIPLRSFAHFKSINPRLTLPDFFRRPEVVPPVQLTDEGMDEDAYIEKYGTRPYVDCARDRLSTFGMDVDTAAYTRTRALLREGKLPSADMVKVEEFVNYFKQAYKVEGGEAFGVFAEAAHSPFSDGALDVGPGAKTPRQLLKIGIKSRDPRPNERKPATLTFVVDTSGSMNRPFAPNNADTRMNLVKAALKELVAALNPDDAVSIVGFSEQAEMILPRTQARQRQRVLDGIDSMQANGSTNVESGLLLGLRIADEAYAADSINRMVLISDGMANVGARGPDELLKTVRAFAQRGIDLSTMGIGMGKVNDEMLRKFADTGNGASHYADSVDEAKKILLEKLPPHLNVLARDAKVQVEFNPDVVKSYRLLGYEKRKIADKDFRNDAVDAGEVAHNTLVTALYEIARQPGAHGSLGKVYLRWKDAGYVHQPVVERNYPLSEGIEMGPASKASPEFRFLACVARFAELLRGSKWTRHGSYGEVLAELDRLPAAFRNKPECNEIYDLVTRARNLSVLNWKSEIINPK